MWMVHCMPFLAWGQPLCNYTVQCGSISSKMIRLLIWCSAIYRYYLFCSPGTLNYLGSQDLSIYFVENISIAQAKLDDDTNAVEVLIVLRRRLQGILLTTFLPTICLHLIFLSTFYFKPDSFDGAVGVNLTGKLLVNWSQVVYYFKVFATDQWHRIQMHHISVNYRYAHDNNTLYWSFPEPAGDLPRQVCRDLDGLLACLSVRKYASDHSH